MMKIQKMFKYTAAKRSAEAGQRRTDRKWKEQEFHSFPNPFLKMVEELGKRVHNLRHLLYVLASVQLP